ncbi:hypothetical protein HPB47_002784 [Ixodes persulcatus]|uniref:Uncharacterized protein n=1 Tax=Ixodes persulcatus TaxID=34615 RepID=A0AC60PK69_IXOPE|nr:hypothetical protein HPB47_002784 [Ixodes persulcatus]
MPGSRPAYACEKASRETRRTLTLLEHASKDIQEAECNPSERRLEQRSTPALLNMPADPRLGEVFPSMVPRVLTRPHIISTAKTPGAKGQMAYAIVEFLHLEQVDVVPALWIQDEHCAWPDQAKRDKIIVMVKKAVPPDASWKGFAVAVKGLFATYEQARKKLERSHYTSELSSDSERPQGKRMRRPPPQWSQSDEEPVRH